MKKYSWLWVLLFLTSWQGQAQYLNISDTAAMLYPYLRKADTSSLSNRINAVAGMNLQQVTDLGSTTSHSITAAQVRSTNFFAVNSNPALNSAASLYMINKQAPVNNQTMQLMIKNTTAGGGGTSSFLIRHNKYDNVNDYNVLEYAMNGANSALTLGSPTYVLVKSGGSDRMFIGINGVGINTTQPAHPLHVVGNAAFTGGNLMVNTTSDNGATLQVNGTANITGNVAIGGVALAEATEKLTVNGNVRAKKVTITQTGWADYVFDSTYRLMPLTELADFIQHHKYLPGMVAARQVEKEGLDIGEVARQQQVKIEEMMLYIINEDKRLGVLEEKLNALENKKSRRQVK